MKLAVKLLRRSDLTFFEAQFRQVNAGNQKSLNLNKSVLVDLFYPALGELQHKAVIPVRLSIWGPNGAEEMRLSRSIAKEAKNWRLNGEFVHSPDVEPTRFDSLMPDDLALLRFDGTPSPNGVTLVIVSATASEDSQLYTKLKPLAGSNMRAVSADDLLAALVNAPPDHPARQLVWDQEELADLEDAADGDAAAGARLAARRKVGRDELAKARARASEIGFEGEALIANWLSEREAQGHIKEWRWVADEDAVSPFDFTVIRTDDTMSRVEVKTTSTSGTRAFHISIAEITAAAQGSRYDLYRLSCWDGTSASLRIADDIGEWASALLGALQALPVGVRPQDFLVDEEQFSWSEPCQLKMPADEEEDGDQT